MKWTVDAKCNPENTNVFFSESVAKAKALCKECPVRDSHCLDYTRTIEQRHGRHSGVWAGLTENERRLLWTAPPRS